MCAYISAADFGLRTWPPEKRLVALLSAYFDDSRADGDVWAVAGFVGYKNQWEYFETLWQAAMAKHGVPYFHMREMAYPKTDSPFAKWHPPEAHDAERTAYFIDIVDVIQKCGLRRVSSVVWLSDLQKFNAQNGTALEAYPLAAFSCLIDLQRHYGHVPMTATFDRIEKVDDKIRKAREYADSDPAIYPKSWLDGIASFGLPRGITSRETPALQAADFIAWEYRKAIFGMKEWRQSEGRPETGRDAQWSHYLEWTRQRTGGDPTLRKSLGALIEGRDGSQTPTLWDFEQLDMMHKLRNGVWTLGAADVAAKRA